MKHVSIETAQELAKYPQWKEFLQVRGWQVDDLVCGKDGKLARVHSFYTDLTGCNRCWVGSITGDKGSNPYVADLVFIPSLSDIIEALAAVGYSEGNYWGVQKRFWKVEHEDENVRFAPERPGPNYAEAAAECLLAVYEVSKAQEESGEVKA